MHPRFPAVRELYFQHKQQLTRIFGKPNHVFLHILTDKLKATCNRHIHINLPQKLERSTLNFLFEPRSAHCTRGSYSRTYFSCNAEQHQHWSLQKLLLKTYGYVSPQQLKHKEIEICSINFISHILLMRYSMQSMTSLDYLNIHIHQCPKIRQ